MKSGTAESRQHKKRLCKTSDGGLHDIIIKLREQQFTIKLIHVESKVADVLSTEVVNSEGSDPTSVVINGTEHTLDERLTYRIYTVSTGTGQAPRYLISEHGFQLGYRRGRFRFASEPELYALDPAPPVPALRAMVKAVGVSEKMTVPANKRVHDAEAGTVESEDAELEEDEDGVPQKKRQQVTASSGVLWQRLIDKHKKVPFFLVEDVGLTPLETGIVATMDAETWGEVVDFAVSANHVPDESLLTAFKSMLVNIGEDTPITLCDLRGVEILQNVQRTAPHAFVVGQTKCGKSAMATSCNAITNLGDKFDKGTAAGALGFISVDKARKGSLHEASGLVTFDEVTSYDKYDIFSQLLSLMESGTTSITQAGSSQAMRTLATLMFVSNAIGTDHAASFTRTMTYISENAEGFGSRLGWILFNDYAPSRKMYDDVTQDDVLAVQHIVRIMLMRNRGKFNEIFKYLDSLSWFKGPPADYIEAIGAQIADMAQDAQTYKLWHHHCNENNKHVSGAAFRLWAIEHLLDIDRTASGTDMLYLVLAAHRRGGEIDDRLTRVARINKSSLRYMLDTVVAETPQVMLVELEAMKRIDRVAVLGCGCFASEHTQDGHVHEMPMAAMWAVVRDELVTAGIIHGGEDPHYFPSQMLQKLSKRTAMRLRGWGVIISPENHLVTLTDGKCASMWNFKTKLSTE